MKILRRKYKFSELYILRKSLLKLLLSPKRLLNFFLVRISLFFKMEKCLGLPIHINIEPTGSCNYQCIKCERFSDIYVDDGPVFNDKNMPFEYYRQIINDIGDTLLTLRLWNYGEPLINKDIFDMIKYAKKKNVIVAISSNLSLLTSESAKDLICSGLDYLVVSFDGASSETYNLYHGRRYFDKVVNNIEALVKSKKSLRYSTPLIELQFIVMKENEEEINKIRNLAGELGVDKMTYLRIHKDRLNLSKFKGFDSNADILPKNKDFCLNKEEIRRIIFCSIPWEGTLIRYSGLVLPCVSDIGQQHGMGRLFQNGNYLGFRKLWNNYNYRKFRRQIASNINRLETCFDCAQRNNNIKDQIQFNERV